jgi:hypothetical protein
MSPERVEDAESLRSFRRACVVAERNVSLEIVVVASEAQHVALAEALVVGTLELRDPERKRVRVKPAACSVVDE